MRFAKVATFLKHLGPRIEVAKSDRNLSPLIGILGRKNRRAVLESVSQPRLSLWNEDSRTARARRC
ncbi:MAG: hypothetical protein C0469_01505 [Cyanobacteria bacterium DS2.3.42]|nr:hypothetical protein [Cyanobacteria bacterium DS2.3.42]